MKDIDKQGFATRAIHAGQQPEPVTGAIMTPIFASSTFVMPEPGKDTGYDYGRSTNPTREAFEECVASLENGTKGIGFASGLAAAGAILELLEPGDHVVAMDDLYGGVNRLLKTIRSRSAKIETTFADLSIIENLHKSIRPETKMIWVETPSNPLLKLVDLKVVAKIAQESGIISVCDNTLASPWIQRPLDLGFDIVFHSATKYLNGHSDIIGGVAVVGVNQELADQLHLLQYGVGGIMGPFDAFLALRGLKTLDIRMERHSQNAEEIARFLENHPKVERVLYPGLESHPQHELCKSQMRTGGGVITLFLKGGMEDVKRFFSQCKLFALAVSLGGVESLAEHPASMTHVNLSPENRQELGISDSLIRLSVGIEEVDDLIDELDRALDVV